MTALAAGAAFLLGVVLGRWHFKGRVVSLLVELGSPENRGHLPSDGLTDEQAETAKRLADLSQGMARHLVAVIEDM